MLYTSSFIACSGCSDQSHDTVSSGIQNGSDGDSITTRFSAPLGFDRLRVAENGFESYLRHLPLKPEGSPLLNFNGGVLEKEGVYAAVVDLPIGNKDLHQCADAVMLSIDATMDQVKDSILSNM